jgi:hypothetical protein
MPRWLLPWPLFFIFTSPVLALTLSVTDLPSSVDINQDFTAKVSLDCACTGSSFFRGVFFYPDSSTSYSGFTQNNLGEWVGSSSDRTQYFQTSAGSFSGQLKFKFDPQKSPGSYYFKVGRYSSSGDSSADWSNTLAVSVSGPSPTPLPTSTPKPLPTNSPVPTLKSTSTPKPPTPTPKSTPVPTLMPTATIRPSSSPTVKPTLISPAIQQFNNVTMQPTPNNTPISAQSPPPTGQPVILGISAVVNPPDSPPTPLAGGLVTSGVILCLSSAFILLAKSGKIYPR